MLAVFYVYPWWFLFRRLKHHVLSDFKSTNNVLQNPEWNALSTPLRSISTISPSKPFTRPWFAWREMDNESVQNDKRPRRHIATPTKPVAVALLLPLPALCPNYALSPTFSLMVYLIVNQAIWCRIITIIDNTTLTATLNKADSQELSWLVSN